MEETKICEENDEKLVERAANGDDASTTTIDWDSDHFHRHCQKTICSAHGNANGEGATWNLIDELTLPKLTNLCSNWKTYFTRNNDNITQDLKSILELIDNVVSGIGEFTLRFTDNNNDEIDSKTINPLSPNPTTFTGFGCRVTFTMDDNEVVSFNTMGDNQTRELPAQTLNVTYSGGTVTGDATCVMAEPATIDIQHDYNYVPIKSMTPPPPQGTPEYQYDCASKYEILDGKSYVYRYNAKRLINVSATDTRKYFPKFAIDLRMYQTSIPETQKEFMAQWEVHIYNDFSESITMSAPGRVHVKVINAAGTVNSEYFGPGIETTKYITALTDQLTIPGKKTAVYVFRACIGDNEGTRRFTYSLAYIA